MKENKTNELIDTLWNVNMKLLLVLLVAKQELIDTLWNVNDNSCNFLSNAFKGINRYIMECK